MSEQDGYIEPVCENSKLNCRETRYTAPVERRPRDNIAIALIEVLHFPDV